MRNVTSEFSLVSDFHQEARRLIRKATDPELLEIALLDCYGRFLSLLPTDLLQDHLHLYFQIQQSHWWYIDIWADAYSSTLPRYSLSEFGLIACYDCPVLSKFVPLSQYPAFFYNWKEYCKRIPLRGAVILNQSLTKCLLVKPWKGRYMMFPRGKIGEMEDDLVCACREVWEETGADISHCVHKDVFVESSAVGNPLKLFIAPGFSENTNFTPQLRKEIKSIHWVSISELPTSSRNSSSSQFWNVHKFVPGIKAWIEIFKNRQNFLPKHIRTSERSNFGQILDVLIKNVSVRLLYQAQKCRPMCVNDIEDETFEYNGITKSYPQLMPTSRKSDQTQKCRPMCVNDIEDEIIEYNGITKSSLQLMPTTRKSAESSGIQVCKNGLVNSNQTRRFKDESGTVRNDQKSHVASTGNDSVCINQSSCNGFFLKTENKVVQRVNKKSTPVMNSLENFQNSLSHKREALTLDRNGSNVQRPDRISVVIFNSCSGWNREAIFASDPLEVQSVTSPPKFNLSNDMKHPSAKKRVTEAGPSVSELPSALNSNFTCSSNRQNADMNLSCNATTLSNSTKVMRERRSRTGRSSVAKSISGKYITALDRLNGDTFGTNTSRGWNIEEMFRLNAERFGFQSTYTMDEYSVSSHVSENCLSPSVRAKRFLDQDRDSLHNIRLMQELSQL